MAKATPQLRRFDLREELRATAERRKRPHEATLKPLEGVAEIACRLGAMFPELPQDTVEAALGELFRLDPDCSRDQLAERAINALQQMSATTGTPQALTCFEPMATCETDPCETGDSDTSDEFPDEALDDQLAALLSLSEEDLGPCIKTMVGILSRIAENPDEQKFRMLKRSNARFQSEVGKHAAAVSLLHAAGFVDLSDEAGGAIVFAGDPASSARFIRVYDALRGVAQDLAVECAATSAGDGAAKPASGTSAAAVSMAALHADARSQRRQRIAELTEQRLKDPRGFREAAQSRGLGNRGFSALQRPPGAATSDGRSRRSKHFTLADIDRMRVQDEIAGAPNYAEEYRRTQQAAPATNYSTLVARSYDPELIARQALDGTNQYRASKGLAPLRWNDGIAKIAKEHAEQMASGAMPFSHAGFDQRVKAYPVPHRSAAENLALNKGVAEVATVAVEGWIKSPGHEKNLRGAYNLCGIGVARASDGTFYLTQLFANAF